MAGRGRPKKDHDAEIAKARLEDKGDEAVTSTGISPEQIELITGSCVELFNERITQDNKYFSENLRELKGQIENTQKVLKDVVSRIESIEQFREPGVIESKIGALVEDVENCRDLIRQAKVDMKKQIEDTINQEIKAKVSAEVKLIIEKMTK
jgi:hypothetical protein